MNKSDTKWFFLLFKIDLKNVSLSKLSCKQNRCYNLSSCLKTETNKNVKLFFRRIQMSRTVKVKFNWYRHGVLDMAPWMDVSKSAQLSLKWFAYQQIVKYAS